MIEEKMNPLDPTGTLIKCSLIVLLEGVAHWTTRSNNRFYPRKVKDKTYHLKERIAVRSRPDAQVIIRTAGKMSSELLKD
jgi:hypothetical protein